jgi:aminopeptidase 2
VGNTADLLELIGHFEDEKEFIVWNEIAARLDSLRSVWFEEPAIVRDALQRLEQRLFSKLAHALGWDYADNEDMLTSKLRTLAISKAGRAGDAVIIKEAKRRFDLFLSEDEKALHPNIRGSVLAIVVANGGKEEWEQVLEVYRATTTADQKIMALAAVGATRQPEMIQRALEISLSSDVRPQDTMYLYNSIGSTAEGRYPLWTFVQANWSEYERMYAGSMGLFGHVVKASTSRFSKEEMARDIEAFFSDKDTTHVQRPLEQSLEKLRVNAKWLTRARKDVAAWASSSGV